MNAFALFFLSSSPSLPSLCPSFCPHGPTDSLASSAQSTKKREKKKQKSRRAKKKKKQREKKRQLLRKQERHDETRRARTRAGGVSRAVFVLSSARRGSRGAFEIPRIAREGREAASWEETRRENREQEEKKKNTIRFSFALSLSLFSGGKTNACLCARRSAATFDSRSSGEHSMRSASCPRVENEAGESEREREQRKRREQTERSVGDEKKKKQSSENEKRRKKERKKNASFSASFSAAFSLSYLGREELGAVCEVRAKLEKGEACSDSDAREKVADAESQERRHSTRSDCESTFFFKVFFLLCFFFPSWAFDFSLHPLSPPLERGIERIKREKRCIGSDPLRSPRTLERLIVLAKK